MRLAAMRGRGRWLFMREVVARPESPSRCTLPITALRVTLPSRPAIWLALKPFGPELLQQLYALIRPSHKFRSLELQGRAH